MELYGSILGAIGSVASIISLIVFWSNNDSLRLRGALFTILILTGLSTYFSYNYYVTTQPEIVRGAKQAELRKAAKKFLADNRYYSSYWNTGKNEGFIKSGLILLELYKELYPDTYQRIKSDVNLDMAYAQNFRDKAHQRQSMQTAAESIRMTIKSLAGDEE